MAYATRVDLVARYGEDDVVQRESMLPAGATAQVLADADAEIDSYLSGRYVVPVSPVPPVLARLACEIARYRLLGTASDERARNGYTDAVNWLKGVQAGRTNLAGATPLIGSAPAATVELVCAERVFRRGAR